MKSSFWLALAYVLSLLSGAHAATNHGEATYGTYTAAGWNMLESDNFRFCSKGPLKLDASLIKATESLRSELAARWLAEQAAGRWSPKCDVVLHATAAAYLSAVPGGGQTVGCSLIHMADGRVTGRRIDIRADRPGWFGAAFGHELTHVVLADKFSDGRLPAWADEGMAVLADSGVKQDAHQRDLHVARSSRRTFRLVELFALDGYPAAERQAAFYGQSASLVRYLVARGTPEQFVTFLIAAGSDGYDSAARKVYGLRGVRELERDWLQYVSTSGTLARN